MDTFVWNGVEYDLSWITPQTRFGEVMERSRQLFMGQGVPNHFEAIKAYREAALARYEAQVEAGGPGSNAPGRQGDDAPGSSPGQALLRLPRDPSGGGVRRGAGVGRMMGPPLDEPETEGTKPLTVGATFEGIRGDQTHPATITSIERGPDGTVTGARITYAGANGQQVPGRISADGLQSAGFDLGDEFPTGEEPGFPPIPTAQPGPVGEARTSRGFHIPGVGNIRSSLFGTEGPEYAGTPTPNWSETGMGGPGSLESDRAIELRDILAQTGGGGAGMGGMGSMGGIGGAGNLPYNTGGISGAIPDAATNPWEQQGLSDVLRSIVLGQGITPGFRPLEEARLERFTLPFLVNQSITGGETDSPALFRQYLASQASGGGSPQLGSALAQAGSFLGQDFGPESPQERAQIDIRRMLESPTTGAVGTELFAPLLAIIGQGRGRRFGIDQGPSMAEALTNQLAADPSLYTSAEQMIQALQQQGILDWLNRRF